MLSPFTCNFIQKCLFHSNHKMQLNCNRTSVAKIGRTIYTKMYPTILVFSDGSSINIRYHEPRKIIKLPLDITTLTEEDRKKRLAGRKPKTKVIIEEKIEDNFSIDNYKHLWSK